MKRKPSFIIYAPDNEISGGAIVLHLLNKLLIKQGHNSHIYKMDSNERVLYNNLIQVYTKKISYCVKKIVIEIIYLLSMKRYFSRSINKRRSFIMKPCLNKNAIVVYPEIISGNPLGANNAVRWLLYKPGFFTNEINYGKNDLFFCYQKVFNDLKFNPDENMLTVTLIKRDVFQQTNFKKRSGNCYIVRKGKDREDLPPSFDGPVIDDLPDENVSEIFNQCEYCISYDPYTFYSTYASLCGCISVVEPLKGVTKDEWQPKKEMQYGISYGRTTEEINFAKDTKHKMEEYIDSIEQENVKQVQNFVSVCKKKFGFD